MNLEKIYFDTKTIINNVDFSLLWEGFQPLKFAVYNEKECFFDGKYIDKTDEFMANTAVMYKGEYIAIWQIVEDMDVEILAAKLIHEMFHAFQMKSFETRFANEIEALTKYNYSAENLSAKIQENYLLVNLLENYNEADYKKFLSIRKYRLVNFEYEFKYESAIEQIEGSANYIELNALKQISIDEYNKKIEGMKISICNPTNLLPIRIISYSIGAIVFELLKRNNLFSFERFSNETTAIQLVKDIEQYSDRLQISQDIKKTIDEYNLKTDKIVEAAILNNNCVLDGEYELLGVNVYNARYHNGYVVSTYFIMYKNKGENSFLYGDYVIKLNSKNSISKVYMA